MCGRVRSGWGVPPLAIRTVVDPSCCRAPVKKRVRHRAATTGYAASRTRLQRIARRGRFASTALPSLNASRTREFEMPLMKMASLRAPLLPEPQSPINHGDLFFLCHFETDLPFRRYSNLNIEQDRGGEGEDHEGYFSVGMRWRSRHRPRLRRLALRRGASWTHGIQRWPRRNTHRLGRRWLPQLQLESKFQPQRQYQPKLQSQLQR